MRFSGKIYKDGRFWLAEIPILDAMTQGHTRKEALEMAADMIETMANKEGFRVKVSFGSGDEFEVGSANSKPLISLLLKRKRELSGLSLSQAAERLGASSRNAYARYEQGRSDPTVKKLSELLHAICPYADFVIKESAVA
jgi:predicted RNase H-like HicB family nuclease/DNA-binding XRE family transcriptional regulator